MKATKYISSGLVAILITACGSGSNSRVSDANNGKNQVKQENPEPILFRTTEKVTSLGKTKLELYTGILKTDSLTPVGSLSYVMRTTKNQIGADGYPNPQYYDVIIPVNAAVYAMKSKDAGTARLVTSVPEATAQLMKTKKFNSKTQIAKIVKGEQCVSYSFPGNDIIQGFPVDFDAKSGLWKGPHGNFPLESYSGLINLNHCSKKIKVTDEIPYTDGDEIIQAKLIRTPDTQNFKVKSVNELGVRESANLVVQETEMNFDL